MLADSDATATIAVKELETAKKFYKEKIGLPLVSEQMGVLTFKSGTSRITVYLSQYAGTNKATSATWVVPDVEPIVASLKSKGVKFEHYDNLPGLTRKGHPRRRLVQRRVAQGSGRKHPAHSQRVKPMTGRERSPVVTRSGGRR